MPAATCQHIHLKVVPPYLTATPVRCTVCDTAFDLAGAAQHAKALNVRRGVVSPKDQALVFIDYPLAMHTDGDSSDYCFRLPSLGVDVTAETRELAMKKLNESIYLALIENAVAGRLPPVPLSVEEIVAMDPSLEDWEWSIAPTVITNFLEKLPPLA